MKYTVWFCGFDHEKGILTPRYDVFSGSRYECYKYRNAKTQFRYQYKVVRGD